MKSAAFILFALLLGASQGASHKKPSHHRHNSTSVKHPVNRAYKQSPHGNHNHAQSNPIGDSLLNTQWIEYANNPIFDPYPTQLQEDYWPYVIYRNDSFGGWGGMVPYKMWFQSGDMSSATISIGYSSDGINWVIASATDLPSPAFHPSVVFDIGGFGGGPFHYMIYYWTGDATEDPSSINIASSNDGVSWTNISSMTQNPSAPLVDGSPLLFRCLGPGDAVYNPNAVPVAGFPFSFPFVLLYDVTQDISSFGAPEESIGLAYSIDGYHFSRFSIAPIYIPLGSGQWTLDGTHAYRGSLVTDGSGVRHIFYSGSNTNYNDGVPTAHGIFHLITINKGNTWSYDPYNPTFFYHDPTPAFPWRSGRTYNPHVIYSQSALPHWKMWFNGGTGSNVGIDQAIGYAFNNAP